MTSTERERVEETEDEVEGLRAMLSEDELSVDEAASLARRKWLQADAPGTREGHGRRGSRCGRQTQGRGRRTEVETTRTLG